MADEAGYLELLVANERVGRWLDVLCDPYQVSKHRHALQQLQQDLQRGPSYVEEANRLGAVPILTRLLSTTTDEGTMDVLSSMISLCSGPMACGGKVSQFNYGPITVHVREGALGDGLGAKVWSVCHIMVRELLAHPEIFQDQLVLELGSGTGLVGLVAALAGAQQVTLTDHEHKVLINLRTCMHMNAPAQHNSSSTAAAPPASTGAGCLHQQSGPHSGQLDAEAVNGSAGPQQQQQIQQHQQQQQRYIVPDDAELFDDAESVEDFSLGELMAEPAPAAAAAVCVLPDSCGADSARAGAVAAASSQEAWEVSNMCVRLLDWQESEDALLQEQAAHEQPPQPSQPPQETEGGSGPPHVPLSQRFPVILGNEVMYEPGHARLVAAAIKHRLQPGGRVLLCCAVRDQAVFDAFRDTCRRWDLRYRAVRVQPQGDAELGGIAGPERDYEGGFLLMAVDHEAAPACDWHRDDFVVVE